MFSKLMDEHVSSAARDTLTGPPVEFTVKACVCQLRTEHTVNNVFLEDPGSSLGPQSPSAEHYLVYESGWNSGK